MIAFGGMRPVAAGQSVTVLGTSIGLERPLRTVARRMSSPLQTSDKVRFSVSVRGGMPTLHTAQRDCRSRHPPSHVFDRSRINSDSGTRLGCDRVADGAFDTYSVRRASVITYIGQ